MYKKGIQKWPSLSFLAVAAVLLSSFLLVSSFSLAYASSSVLSNLDGVTWNAEYTVCTLGSTTSGNPVDGSALQAEIANHTDTIKTFKTETGAQLEGSVASLFYMCRVLETADFSQLQQSKVTDMNQMFFQCYVLSSLDLIAFDTTEVRDMHLLFSDCSSLSFLDISSFDTGNVTNMANMFNKCSLLSSLDVSTFDTKNVTNINGMFLGCSSLSTLDVSSFNTEKVEDMMGMFAGCSSLTLLDVSNFDTKNVIEMEEMFEGCSSLTSINLSAFNFEKLEMCFQMFANCDSLEEINLGKLVLPEDEDASWAMFAKMDEDYRDVQGSISNIQKITMDGDCILTSGVIISEDESTGTFFDYKAPLPWGAYQNGVRQATLTGFDEFKAYQQTHPGATTFVLNDEPGPSPEPTPDPEPEPTPGTEDGWVQSDAGWQYVLNGEYLNDGWHYFEDEYGNHWYYFDSDTYIATSRWIWDDAWEGWYWVCSTGPMIENLWQWIDNAWYGFWWGGKMCQGWVWDTAYVAWYYCDDYTGRVACSEWAWDGAWYYFNQNCQMQSSCWVGDYWLNEHGMWV